MLAHRVVVHIVYNIVMALKLHTLLKLEGWVQTPKPNGTVGRGCCYVWAIFRQVQR